MICQYPLSSCTVVKILAAQRFSDQGTNTLRGLLLGVLGGIKFAAVPLSCPWPSRHKALKAVGTCRADCERMSLEVARSFLVEADTFESIEALTNHAESVCLACYDKKAK